MGDQWWSKAILIGAVVAAALLPLGALGSRFGLWPFTAGFVFLSVGAVVAAAAALLGIVGLIFAAAKGLKPEFMPLGLGAVVGVGALAVLFVQYSAARSVPPIHNISTDVEDPPAFNAIVALRGDGSNPHTYDPAQPVGARTLALAQREAWPALTTKRLALGLDQATEQAIAIVEAMGLALVNAKLDAAKGESVIEATDTTFWFGFEDDMVVRLRADGDGTLVDARSVSRVGQSDLGLNAKRIQTFLEGFEAGAPAAGNGPAGAG